MYLLTLCGMNRRMGGNRSVGRVGQDRTGQGRVDMIRVLCLCLSLSLSFLSRYVCTYACVTRMFLQLLPSSCLVLLIPSGFSIILSQILQ